MPLSPGSILYHRYRIVKLLGQGGFGAVYRAWDISLEKPCAIKENLVSDEAAQRQFKREAVLLANLTHPNLPRVSDHFIISDQGQYLVMDFIDGENLEELQLRNQGALPEALVLYWIGQICDALSYLHEQGVIHRDVKPANIRIASMKRGMDRAMQAGVLFDPLTAAFDETRPYLVDFGIAKSGGGSAGAQATTIGARAVTPGFSPLEQYGGQGHTDERSDIFALGATIYCLLTGSTPPDIVDVMAGISQPAKGIILAPNLRCSSAKGVRRRGDSISVQVNSGKDSKLELATKSPEPMK